MKKYLNEILFLDPIIRHNIENSKCFIRNTITHFFKELDHYIFQNKDYSFFEYFNESTYLSLLGNGVIRNDKEGEVNFVQEYNVQCLRKVGRCDGFLKNLESVYFIESKLQKFKCQVDEGHWNVEQWMKYDEFEIKCQLREYYDAQLEYLDSTIHKQHYLLTIVFKVLKENALKHIEMAEKSLVVDESNSLNKDWYYSVAFLNKPSDQKFNGIEIYGTIEHINR